MSMMLYFKVAAGSLEVLFVEDQVNSDEVTSMIDIQNNFHMNLEDGLVRLATTMDRARREVDVVLDQTTTTTSESTIITEVGVMFLDYCFV